MERYEEGIERYRAAHRAVCHCAVRTEVGTLLAGGSAGVENQ